MISSRFSLLLCFLAISFVFVTPNFIYAEENIPKLFIEENSFSARSLSASSFSELTTDSSLMSTPPLQFNFDALNSDKLYLNFFDKSLLLEKYEIEYSSPSDFLWIGKIQGENQHIVLNINGNELKAATIRTSEGSYSIDPVGANYNQLIPKPTI